MHSESWDLLEEIDNSTSMWKDTTFASKYDDDSAIGDSANNSAGEESSHSQRKSFTSDEEDPLVKMNEKFGIGMPDCLLRSGQSSRHGQQQQQQHSGSSKRTKPVIQSTLSHHKKAGTDKKQANKSHEIQLHSKLEYLIVEMVSALFSYYTFRIKLKLRF